MNANAALAICSDESEVRNFITRGDADLDRCALPLSSGRLGSRRQLGLDELSSAE